MRSKVRQKGLEKHCSVGNMEDSTGKNRGNMAIYPPVNIQKAIENGPFIVDLLIYPFKMVIFHRFLYVYQRFLHDFSMKIHGGALRR